MRDQNYVEDTLRRLLSDDPQTSLPGWCTPEKGLRLYTLALGAELCVELGVFGGRSLIALALALEQQSFGEVHGIDPYTPSAALEGTNDPANDEWWARLNYDEIARVAQEALYSLRLVSYAHLIRLRSNDVVRFYRDGSIDLLHQDSNHSEEVSCAEVRLWAPKVRSGGYWVQDDTNWPTTQRAQAEIEGLGFVPIETHESWKIYRRA